jgi:hypothetical protein
MLDFAALLTTLAAVFSDINYRFSRLPATIGVVVLALLLGKRKAARSRYFLMHTRLQVCIR